MNTKLKAWKNNQMKKARRTYSRMICLQEVLPELPESFSESYYGNTLGLVYFAVDLKGSLRKVLFTPLLDAGWEMEKGPKVDSGTSCCTFSYLHPKAGQLKVSLTVIGENANCRYVGTGRFIEEKELVCDD